MRHISETQINHFQAVLLNALAELRVAVTDILIHSNHISHNLAAKKIDKISADALLELIQKIEIPALASKASQMINIDAALNNMQIGMYGLCSDCEEAIEIDRLNSDATTQRCLNCENKYLQQKCNHFRL